MKLSTFLILERDCPEGYFFAGDDTPETNSNLKIVSTSRRVRPIDYDANKERINGQDWSLVEGQLMPNKRI